MPRLGAGLDRLNWEDSKQTNLTVFKNQNLRLSVYVHHLPTVRRGKTSFKVNESLSDDEETLPYGLGERLSGHDLIHDEQDDSTESSNVAVSGSTHNCGNVSDLCTSGPPSDRTSSGEPLPPSETSTKPAGGRKPEAPNSEERSPPSDRISSGEHRPVNSRKSDKAFEKLIERPPNETSAKPADGPPRNGVSPCVSPPGNGISSGEPTQRYRLRPRKVTNNYSKMFLKKILTGDMYSVCTIPKGYVDRVI